MTNDVTHLISYEPQPIADQWQSRCTCGWKQNVSVNDFPTRETALAEAERIGREHLHSQNYALDEHGLEFRQ